MSDPDAEDDGDPEYDVDFREPGGVRDRLRMTGDPLAPEGEFAA